MGALVLAMLPIGAMSSATAAVGATLSITPLEWNIVGLDSNNVNVGPNQYPTGAQVCNTSTDTASDVVSMEFAWSVLSVATYINIDGPLVKDIEPLAALECRNVWWTVEVTRLAASYDQARAYTISAASPGSTTVTTPSDREIYVEHFVSQARNGGTLSGPTTVVTGETVTYTLSGFTATNGYEQLASGAVLDGSIFDVVSVSSTYAKPVGGSTNDAYYADACGWQPSTASVDYRSCVGPEGFVGGKAGGDPIVVTVVAKVVGTGSGIARAIIYDFSGSSYHYNSSPATIVVTATEPAPPAPPVAADDSALTSLDVPVVVHVPHNDRDPDDDLDLTSVSIVPDSFDPAKGELSVDPVTGNITYTPAAGFIGDFTFDYEICDLTGLCDTAHVTVTVEADPILPSPPVAEPDSGSTLAGVPVEVDVSLNDSDPDGDLDPTTVTIVPDSYDPLAGALAIDPVTGAVTYTPADGFVGEFTFQYEICDLGGLCDTALVTITVVAPPVAEPDTESTLESVPVDVDVPVNDSDPDGDLDVTSVTIVPDSFDPLNGSLSVDPTTGVVTYTPAAGFTGEFTFQYEICDLGDRCDTALVTITVTADVLPPAPPVAEDNTTTTLPGVPVVIDVVGNDSDPDGDLDPDSVTIVEEPTDGMVSVDPITGAITYTPRDGFTGSDTFIYRICDLQPACTDARVTVTVVAAPIVLAFTGANVGLLGTAGLVLVAAGLILALLSRRRKVSGRRSLAGKRGVAA